MPTDRRVFVPCAQDIPAWPRALASDWAKPDDVNDAPLTPALVPAALLADAVALGVALWRVTGKVASAR